MPIALTARGQADILLKLPRRSGPPSAKQACSSTPRARSCNGGRHEKAYLALRAAEQTAPEEVAGRPPVHRLIRELLISAPPGIGREAEQFASQIGVSR